MARWAVPGKITGAVTLNNSATIDGGTVGTVGTLSTGALTLNNTSILRVDMTGNPTPTADQISVTGAVNSKRRLPYLS